MAYTKTVWQDRQVTFPLRFTQTLVSGTTYDLVPAEGTIITSGTPINATNLNNIENGIEALDTGKLSLTGGTMTGTLTGTTINATSNLQENGTNLTAKYLRLNGSNNMTGDLWITKVSSGIVFDDTDAIGTRCAITNYQSKLSFRYGANSTTNEMMYLDGVTGLTFKPNLSFTASGTIGQSGIHMKNSDIVGLNGLYFNDDLQTDGEGFNFPKTGLGGSTTQADYNCLRVDGSGRMRLAGDVIASVEAGTAVWTGNSVLVGSTTITPTVSINNCPNGWLLEWRQSTGTAFLHYEPVYKHSGQDSVMSVNAGYNSPATYAGKNVTISGGGTTLVGSDANNTGNSANRVLTKIVVF